MTNQEFSVLDVETTGFSPQRHDRIIEIGITRVTGDGHIVDTLESLVNPGRDVGATSIHGISASMVVEAPRFEDIAPAIVEFMDNSVVVSHNASFDNRFLVYELTVAGYDCPAFSPLCTLKLARELLHDVPSKKLGCLCDYFGIVTGRQHSALADARATADLLLILGHEYNAFNHIDHKETFSKPVSFVSSSSTLVTRNDVVQSHNTAKSPFSELLKRLPSEDTESAEFLSYSEFIEQALLDREISREESQALFELACELGLSRSQVLDIHRHYLKKLVRIYLLDGKISESERLDIDKVRELLSLKRTDLEQIYAELEQDKTANLMTDIAKTHSGKSVCFTGELRGKINGNPITRKQAQTIAMERGLIVKKGVSKNLDYLVVADPKTESSKARQARSYEIPIVSERAFWGMIGLQVG